MDPDDPIPSDAEAATGDARGAPLIDFRGALRMAGHEVHDLGLDDVADAGPLVHAGTPAEQGETAEELAHRIGPDMVGLDLHPDD